MAVVVGLVMVVLGSVRVVVVGGVVAISMFFGRGGWHLCAGGTADWPAYVHAGKGPIGMRGAMKGLGRGRGGAGLGWVGGCVGRGE